jgi:hypothetical protein
MPSPWEPGFLTFYQAEASSLSPYPTLPLLSLEL